MEKIDEIKKSVKIKFQGREVEILQVIADTNSGVPKAVQHYMGNFSHEEVYQFLKKLQACLQK